MDTVKAGDTYIMRSANYLDLPEGEVKVIYCGPAAKKAFPHFDWDSWEHDGDFVVWEGQEGADFLPLPEFIQNTKLMNSNEGT
ncbi:hypothetical protein [Paenibacillus sp. y28]|uniref:hypothetical protein n=1 Tax=Paenibacillus sp. y28 TaxID=3129110 RepID=UPI003017D64F